QLERVAEVVVCIILGALISQHISGYAPWIFAAVLLFIIRPISIWITIRKSSTVSSFQKRYMAWLGIRGIGSIYYLVYAITHGLGRSTAEVIAAMTFATIVLSILVHGVSVTPLMKLYEKRLKRYRRRIIKKPVLDAPSTH
ncbi:MAG: sodium:proton antiporter, partial [Proteobacteria bacterium]